MLIQVISYSPTNQGARQHFGILFQLMPDCFIQLCGVNAPSWFKKGLEVKACEKD